MKTRLGIVALAIVAGLSSRAGDLEVDGLSALDAANFYGPVAIGGIGTASSSNLNLYYSFTTNGGSVVLDESGNNNTGTVNSATWATNGYSGGAYSFNGTNNWISIPSSTSLHITNVITLTAWVKFKGEGTGNGIFLAKHKTGGLQYGMLRYVSGQDHGFAAFLGTGGSHEDYQGNYTLNDNQWYFLAAKYDGYTVDLFVNGSMSASQVRTGPITGDNVGTLDIGREHQWNEYANCVVDDVRIFNRALESWEIRSMYSGPTTNTLTNVVLTVSGSADISRLKPKGDISMGSFTNGP